MGSSANCLLIYPPTTFDRLNRLKRQYDAHRCGLLAIFALPVPHRLGYAREVVFGR